MVLYSLLWQIIFDMEKRPKKAKKWWLQDYEICLRIELAAVRKKGTRDGLKEIIFLCEGYNLLPKNLSILFDQFWLIFFTRFVQRVMDDKVFEVVWKLFKAYWESFWWILKPRLQNFDLRPLLLYEYLVFCHCTNICSLYYMLWLYNRM